MITTKRENSIYIILSLFTVLLFVDRFMYAGVALLAVGYLWLCRGKLALTPSKMTAALMAVAAVSIGCYAIHAVIGLSTLFDGSTAIKEVFRVVIYLIMIQIMSMTTISMKTYVTFWRLVLAFVVGVAVLQYVKIFDVNTILRQLYGDTVQFIRTEHTEISAFRCGSVFINPNVFACFLVAALGCYLFVLQHRKDHPVMQLLTFGLVGTGLLLSGSRSGLVIGGVIVLVYMFTRIRQNSSKFFANVFLVSMFAALVVCVALLIGAIDLSAVDDLRMFKFREGLGDSFSTKMDVFSSVLSRMDLLNVLVGHGPFNYAKENLLVDFDAGYFITYFGVFGIGVYLFFLRAIVGWGDKTLDGRKFLNRMLLIIFVIFGFTAGIYFNLRMFSIYILMFLPMIAQDEQRVA